MLHSLHSLSRREAMICVVAGVIDIPLDKEREWSDVQHLSDAELRLVERLGELQDAATRESFSLDGTPTPNFGGRPAEERTVLALDALRKIEKERRACLDTFSLGQASDVDQGSDGDDGDEFE
jgi:hypothetical protein